MPHKFMMDVYVMKHLAVWTGRWTQEHKRWVLINPAGCFYKYWTNFSFHAASVHPAVMAA